MTQEVPLGTGARTLASARPPVFDLVGLQLARPRRRALSNPLASPAAGPPGARRSPSPTTCRTRASPEGRSALEWRLGNPYWVGPSNAIQYRLSGRVTRLRAHFVQSAVRSVPARTLSIAGSPALIPRAELARGRGDPPRRPGVLAVASVRGRAPHRRRERVHGGAVGGDRAGDPDLPREGQRLERHRLQLSRRQVRAGVRRPVRRRRAERDRRARGGLQHRLGRHLAARHLRRHEADREGARRDRGADRVAAGRRARRPALDGSPGSPAATRASLPARRFRWPR